MEGYSIHESDGQRVTNITVSMNVGPNDRIITPINSDFIGTDIARTANITNVSGVNDGTNWTSLTIGSDTYGLGGGGASYTFTDGLTETDGTVTNDLYKAMRVPNSRGNVVLGYNESGGNLENIADVNSSQGCLVDNSVLVTKPLSLVN